MSAPHPNPDTKVLVERRVPPISEKVQGKRAAEKELARKKRRMVISEWLDNDEALVAPSPNIKTSSRDMRVEARSKRGENTQRQVPKM